MATFASDITGPNQSVEVLDLDAGTTMPRVVSVAALLLAIAAVIFLIETAGTSPAPEIGRLVLQRDALTLPAVTTIRRVAAPGAVPADGVGPDVSMRDSVQLAIQDVVTRPQPATSRDAA